MRRLMLVSIAAAAALAPGAPAAAAPGPVKITDGPARFTVLSPTLIRLEYAADENFEGRPSLTAVNRALPGARVRTKVVDGLRVIRTDRMLLRYRLGSGPFDASNLSLTLRGGLRRTVAPSFPPAGTIDRQPPPLTQPPKTDPDPSPPTEGNLGGWYRALDGQAGPVELHDGILSRAGWYLLNDSASPLLTADGWFEPRPEREGPYQDGYLFGYGHDYALGLLDFRRLTGPAPLLPRRAFGIWFSRFKFYSARAYHRLVAAFREHRVPLDVLVIDTDFKAPRSWNGWQWSPQFGPDPAGFMRWAHSKGLHVGLNAHPSISTEDPSYGAADAAAGGLIDDGGRCAVRFKEPEAKCGVWDWARPAHAASYFSLHEPFELAGADFWWLDWAGDTSDASAPGLTPDTWINSLYARRARARGQRWATLSRIGASYWDYDAAGAGAWAEHRSSIHFTGDTYSTWEMLDFQSRFTAAEGAGIGHPYVSHDIGGFLGRELAEDLYVRWIQFGAFQPILRLHSDHGRRLPWEYGKRARKISSGFLRLRESFVPYIYTLARQAYDSGLPIARPMYLDWPRSESAYRADGQYMLGDQLLVAPVTKPGNRARARVWFPPGEWVDIFTGERHRGPRAERLSVPLELMPVFARAGAVIPRQPYTSHIGNGRVDPLRVDVTAGADGAFTLYEDDGDGYAYERGDSSRTRLRWREGANRATLAIGRAVGRYGRQPRSRGYELTVRGIERPARLTLRAGGAARRLAGWRYDATARVLVAEIGRLGLAGGRVRIDFEPARRGAAAGEPVPDPD
jgi:hypothetical protein